ncbi:MAG: hypothetical protein ACR2LQ_01795 [Acidimicrobiales bacterium]
MFTDGDGQPIHPHALSQAFERIARRAGVPMIRLHDLRHTHCTLLIKEGVRATRLYLWPSDRQLKSSRTRRRAPDARVPACTIVAFSRRIALCWCAAPRDRLRLVGGFIVMTSRVSCLHAARLPAA